MEILDSSLSFIQNPENSWILYSIAAFMVLDGFILRIITIFLPKFAEQLQEHSLSSKKASSAINLSAYLSTILGIALAIATYYFSHLNA